MMNGFGGMALGWVWPVLLVAGLLVMAWGLRNARRSPSRRDGTPDDRGGSRRGGSYRDHGAREILRERFARGEISQDDYQRRLEALDDR